MNVHIGQDLIDYRHAELVARAEQSRRYREARAVRAETTQRSLPRFGAVRRPFAAMHAWLVAGVL